MSRESFREFDALFHFAKTHMQHTDPSDPRYGYFAWHVRRTGEKLDENPASDGEVYFITALLFAAHRWGKPGPAGGWDYESEANLILHACMDKNGHTGGERCTKTRFAKTRKTSSSIGHVLISFAGRNRRNQHVL